MKIADITKIALFAALLSISSYFVIPLPFTPIVISMHTIIVNLIGLLFSPLQAGYTILVYLLLGFIGFPVFSAGSAGPAKLFGPTGGFYFGFLCSAIIMSMCKGKQNKRIRYLAVTVGIGLPIQHLCAVFFMCLYNGFQVRAAIITVSLPFLCGDILKCIAASMIAATIKKRLS